MSENTKDEAVKAASDRNYRKTRQGYVVSDKMDKTVVVEVEDRVKHALYATKRWRVVEILEKAK